MDDLLEVFKIEFFLWELLLLWSFANQQFDSAVALDFDTVCIFGLLICVNLLIKLCHCLSLLLFPFFLLLQLFLLEFLELFLLKRLVLRSVATFELLIYVLS